MITIFNRKELTVCYNMKRQAKIREILNVNGIDYRVRVVYHNSSAMRSGATGVYGQKADTAYTYYVYVHKKDYERAKYLVNSQGFR